MELNTIWIFWIKHFKPCRAYMDKNKENITSKYSYCCLFLLCATLLCMSGWYRPFLLGTKWEVAEMEPIRMVFDCEFLFLKCNRSLQPSENLIYLGMCVRHVLACVCERERGAGLALWFSKILKILERTRHYGPSRLNIFLILRNNIDNTK